MRNFNTIKLDSKGRLLVPYHIREILDLDEGDEFVIVSHHNGEIKMMPLSKGRTAQLTLHIEDSPGTMAKITELLAKNKINILMSQSKVIERGHLAEWSALLDLSESNELKKLVKDFSNSKMIKRVDLKER